MAENRRYEQVQALTDQLEQGVSDIFTSNRYLDYLRTCSKFHHYSLNNMILIYMQNPNATMVAGYDAWKRNFGRQVKKGERAIKILAPTPYREKRQMDVIDHDTQQPVLNEDGTKKQEEVEVQRIGFRAASVFDVSQTEGRPIPTLVDDLEGDVQEFENFMEAIRRISPVPIAFEEMTDKDGYYHQVEMRIALRSGMSQVQTAAAAVHEVAHAWLHALDPDRLRESAKELGKDQATKEVEAESVSFVVNQYFGIETDANSLGYIASWSKNKELPELRASLKTIRDTAAEMIDGMEEVLEELHKAQEKTQEKAQEKTSAYIDFYVAECDEFPELGNFYEGLSLQQAVEKYKAIMENPRLLHKVPGLGVRYHDPNDAFYSGMTCAIILKETICADQLDTIPMLAKMDAVKDAVSEVRTLFPGFAYHPMKEEEQHYYPEKMNVNQLAVELNRLAKEFDYHDYCDRVESEDDAIEEITFALLAGEAETYYEALEAIAEDGAEDLSDRAKQLLEQLKEWKPDHEETFEPVVKILFTESQELQGKQYYSLKELDQKVTDLDHKTAHIRDPQTGEPKKTYFVQYVIYYEDQGKAQKLPGRMCIGDGYGGLIQSMQKQIQRQLQDEGWMRLHQERGSEMYQSYVADMTNLQEHILPHLQAYCSLEERQPEETANSQEVVTKTDTGKTVERKSPAKANERRQPDQPQTKQGKKKLSIHERLQRNKEMIAAQKGSERKERSVEVI